MGDGEKHARRLMLRNKLWVAITLHNNPELKYDRRFSLEYQVANLANMWERMHEFEDRSRTIAIALRSRSDIALGEGEGECAPRSRSDHTAQDEVRLGTSGTAPHGCQSKSERTLKDEVRPET